MKKTTNELKKIGTRIAEWVDKAGGPTDVSKKLGVNRNTVYSWMETGIIKSPDLIKLSEAGADLAYILGAGYSPMRVNEAGAVYELPGEEGVQFELVKQYKVEASAGGGAFVDAESEIGKLAFRRDWLRQKGLSAKDLVVIRVRGDSMTPTIRGGSLVMVDTRQDHFKDDGIYVLMIEGHLVAKRLQLDVQGDGVHIRSDNPAYGPQHLSKAQAESLNIVGRVVWAGGEI